MLRFLLYLVIAYLLWILLRHVFRSVGGGGDRPRELSGDELVQDPVCGTYVPMSTAVKRKGRYFCSKECARQFKG
ncbi:MAG: PP0621 family protein [Nitrospinota bacterium]